MLVQPTSAEVRHLVQAVLREFGADPQEVRRLKGAARIDRGRVVAQTYRAANFMAMWFVEFGLLQFYDEQGEMLRTINLFENRASQRKAA